MFERNVVIWNVMIGGYMWNGDVFLVIRLFGEIMGSGNEVIWIEMMKGYGKRKEIEKVRDLFERMFLEMKSVKVWVVMFGGYVSS